MRHLLALLILIATFSLPAVADAPRPPMLRAKHAILIDADTSTVLFDRESNDVMYPASMTKLMTVYLIFERIKDGRLKWDDTFSVSRKAWRQQGSRSFIEPGMSVSVRDAVLGIIVHSGNDMSVAAAEALAGSEQAFAELMTEKAKQLGMKNTVFRNATGLHDPGHVSTAADLAILGLRIIKDFPEYYPMYSTPEFTMNGITQPSRNPLLKKDFEGGDGLKTGHTDNAGYGFVGSAIRHGRRLIGVVAGLPSPAVRADDIITLLEWGFLNFDNYSIAKAGQPVIQAPVWLGEHKQASLTSSENLVLTLPVAAARNLKASVQYSEPLPAPLKKGQQVGTIKLEGEPLRQTYTVPLVVSEDNQKVGSFTALRRRLIYLVTGEAG
ncbi:MAG: D-alanyl-D-alanine carboxypeptidase family protein [Holosporales bacterium]